MLIWLLNLGFAGGSGPVIVIPPQVIKFDVQIATIIELNTSI